MDHHHAANAYIRSGQQVPAHLQHAALDLHAENKHAGLEHAPDHEKAAIREALPHLKDSIKHWSKARNTEDEVGEAIQDKKHPRHEEVKEGRQKAYSALHKAKDAAGKAMVKAGHLRRHQSTGSWVASAQHSGYVHDNVKSLLNSHVHDLMKSHDPKHRRQYLARMNGATTGGNHWHWGDGAKWGEAPHWHTKKKGHETYQFDQHHDLKRFQDHMHKQGHSTSVTPGPIDPSTYNPGDPDDEGYPMDYELHVKPHGRKKD